MTDSTFLHWDHLGFISPFQAGNSPSLLDCRYANVVAKARDRSIDPIAVLQLLGRNYVHGNRTLLKGIRRSPWMARPGASEGTWEYSEIPPHGMQVQDSPTIARALASKLRSELLEVCGPCATVGLLLSGGMDSRIVAALLREAQEQRTWNGRVVAVTWGIDSSRDVHYARRIAGGFGWDWTHIPLTPERLYANLALTVQAGCEFSPVHLHAAEDVGRIPGIDLILAASYGDSVGRAVFSGRHVSAIPDLASFPQNPYSLLLSAVYAACRDGHAADVNEYRRRYPRATSAACHEVDHQAHYMRRMLNPCMQAIATKAPLYQMFGTREVFGYMWSLDPACRTDRVYADLLGHVYPRLLDVPWAKTGCRYPDGGDPDNLLREHNYYGRWIRRDLAGEVSKRLFSGRLEALGVFNMTAIRNLHRLSGVIRGPHRVPVDEVMLWLAALADFVEWVGVQGAPGNPAFSLVDGVSAFTSTPRNFLRTSYGI